MHDDVWTIGDGPDILAHLVESIEMGDFKLEITLEQCECTVAEYKVARNKRQDNLIILTREWDNLCNLQEYYKSWPIAELQMEAKKYDAQVCRRKADLIDNIIAAYEQNLLRRIEISKQAVQDLSESIKRFEDYAKYLNAQQVEIA